MAERKQGPDRFSPWARVVLGFAALTLVIVAVVFVVSDETLSSTRRTLALAASVVLTGVLLRIVITGRSGSD